MYKESSGIAKNLVHGADRPRPTLSQVISLLPGISFLCCCKS